MIKKEDIKKWLDEKIWNKAKNDMAGFYEDELLKLIHDCITELSRDVIDQSRENGFLDGFGMALLFAYPDMNDNEATKIRDKALSNYKEYMELPNDKMECAK